MNGEDYGYQVELYVYDLSKGLAKSMSPALLGKQIEGIWHTGVVAYGREYFFGPAGIESCRPGGTILGEPTRVEELGESQVPYQLFLEYIFGLGEATFKPGVYDLFKHNCNIFSDEVSQFLCGHGIPKHILQLPDEILNTPLGESVKSAVQELDIKSSTNTRKVNFANFNNNLDLNSYIPIAPRNHRGNSPDLDELNQAIDQVRLNTLKLEDRRNSLNEKVNRKEKKKEKREKKERKERKRRAREAAAAAAAAGGGGGEAGGSSKAEWPGRRKRLSFAECPTEYPASPRHSPSPDDPQRRHRSLPPLPRLPVPQCIPRCDPPCPDPPGKEPDIGECGATECRAGVTECEARATECRAEATECGAKATECGAKATECGAEASECGAREPTEPDTQVTTEQTSTETKMADQEAAPPQEEEEVAPGLDTPPQEEGVSGEEPAPPQSSPPPPSQPEPEVEREPPIVFREDLDARAEFDGLMAACGQLLSPEEQAHMEELRAYVVEDEGSWALGENFSVLFTRILHDPAIPDQARLHLVRVMAAAALKDDVILLLHQDRRDHTIMNYANRVESLPPPHQEALALFFCNMFEHLSPSEWLLYISEWQDGGQQASNIRVTTKVAVNALLHSDPKVQEYGTAIMYNLGTKEVKTVVFDDVAPELAMAILQYFSTHPPEELLWRAMTALCRFCYSSTEVPALIKMIGPEPSTFKGSSERIDTIIEEIDAKLSRVRLF